jgi:hypothetical protein
MRYVSNTPASTAWFTSNKADIKEKQARNWEVWKQKSPADLAERTLNPEDGL